MILFRRQCKGEFTSLSSAGVGIHCHGGYLEEEGLRVGQNNSFPSIRVRSSNREVCFSVAETHDDSSRSNPRSCGHAASP